MLGYLPRIIIIIIKKASVFELRQAFPPPRWQYSFYRHVIIT